MLQSNHETLPDHARTTTTCPRLTNRRRFLRGAEGVVLDGEWDNSRGWPTRHQFSMSLNTVPQPLVSPPSLQFNFDPPDRVVP
jgi:hypothetical protein